MAGGGRGVFGQSPSGNGVYGVSTTGTGVSGRHTDVTGTDPGVYGETSSADDLAPAIYGHVLGTTPGYRSAAVFGQNDQVPESALDCRGPAGCDEYGVEGIGPIGMMTGSTAAYGYGLLAYDSGKTGSIAIVGYQTASGAYAGYFHGKVGIAGDLDVTGAITAGTKDFRIDDPLEPAHKYLQHASVESDSMLDVYSGNVTTDARGYADVRLPRWFQALNRDFRYQLTILGHAPWDTQARVWNEISRNRFTIRTNHPRVRVSWQVTGTRHDAYARAHPLRVELAKPSAEQGKYLYPHLYRKAESLRVGPPPPRSALRRARG